VFASSPKLTARRGADPGATRDDSAAPPAPAPAASRGVAAPPKTARTRSGVDEKKCRAADCSPRANEGVDADAGTALGVRGASMAVGWAREVERGDSLAQRQRLAAYFYTHNHTFKVRRATSLLSTTTAF
jgi:hypothetical protein